jgi:hypothetical protein
MKVYDWAAYDRFANRVADLNRLTEWWEAPTRDALAMKGRRRVGKSWLFRRFAHGRPAILLVADRVLLTTQMARFADILEGELGVRPDIPDVATLIRLLYQLGRDQKILAVIDEFPFLLPEGAAREAVLSEIQVVMEEHRDASQTKLLLCGSIISQMDTLLHASSPLHGRLRPLDVWPLTFAESAAFTENSDTPEARITRFAVAGGMARYLEELGHGPLEDVVCRSVLDSGGALFNDPRVVLDQELRNPATYFSILEELSANPALTEHLTKKFQVPSANLAPYLETLREMRLVTSSAPAGGARDGRKDKHRISDGFIRFWFRFVFASQEALQSGVSPKDYWAASVEPYLSDFVSPTFEELCVRYTRILHGAKVPTVSSWWGPALDKYRRTKERLTEEIDVVGVNGRNLRIVGEAKWTATPMPYSVLDDLRTYKIPAIAQSKTLKLPSSGPEVLLFARSGFSPELIEAAKTDANVTLVDLETLVDGLNR